MTIQGLTTDSPASPPADRKSTDSDIECARNHYDIAVAKSQRRRKIPPAKPLQLALLWKGLADPVIGLSGSRHNRRTAELDANDPHIERLWQSHHAMGNAAFPQGENNDAGAGSHRGSLPSTFPCNTSHGACAAQILQRKECGRGIVPLHADRVAADLVQRLMTGVFDFNCGIGAVWP